MHPNFATFMLLSGAMFFSGCESMSLGDRGTMAPPPSPYETQPPPLQQPYQDSTPGATASPYVRPPRNRIVEHTVTTGESLWSLSRQYETSIDEIREANQISGDKILAGQKLKIPTNLGEGVALSPTSPEFSPPSPPLPPSRTPSWTVTPPVVPPTSSTSVPQYRIPEPIILPPPGDY